MKLASICVVVLFSVSLCQDFLPYQDSSEPSALPLQVLTLFANGLYSHYNLPSPADLLGCYTDFTATYQMELLSNFYLRAGAYIYGNYTYASVLNSRMQFDRNELSALKTWDCVQGTEDYQKLLEATNFSAVNTTGFNVSLEANQGTIYTDYAQGFHYFITNATEKAGEEFGKLLDTLMGISTPEQYCLNFYKAMWNGVFQDYLIKLPTNLTSCFTTNQVGVDEYLLDYYWAYTIHQDKGANASKLSNDTINFFMNNGSVYEKNIPMSVFECMGSSPDMTRLSEFLGVDVSSQEFEKAENTFILKEPKVYYEVLNSIYEKSNAADPKTTGYYWGLYYKDVANFVNKTEIFENI